MKISFKEFSSPRSPADLEKDMGSGAPDLAKGKIPRFKIQSKGWAVAFYSFHFPLDCRVDGRINSL